MVDPEARGGTQGTSVEGYRRDLSVEADRARLTALNMLPGHGEAAREAQTWLAAAPGAHGHTIEAWSRDGRGWHGAGWRARSAPEGVGVEGYGPPPARAVTPWFGPEACILAAARGVVTWPGGPQTATTERRATGTGWTCVVARRQCAGCPRPARCLATRPQTQGRRVIKTASQAEDDAARARAATPGDALVRQQPPRVARQRAALVRDHDGRRRRYRGQWRVPVQDSADRAGGPRQTAGEAAGPSGGAGCPASGVRRPAQASRRGRSAGQGRTASRWDPSDSATDTRAAQLHRS